MVNTGEQSRRALKRFVSFHKKVTFDGTEKVQLERVEKDEFKLPLSEQVARYDSEELANFWNKENRRYFEIPSIYQRLWRSWKEALMSRTAAIIIIYLLSYYLVNWILEPSC